MVQAPGGFSEHEAIPPPARHYLSWVPELVSIVGGIVLFGE